MGRPLTGGLVVQFQTPFSACQSVPGGLNGGAAVARGRSFSRARYRNPDAAPSPNLDDATLPSVNTCV